MNRYFSSTLAAVLLFGLLAILSVAVVHAKEGDLIVEAQLVWGTNDESSPNPKHKAVDAAVAQKFSKGPFKWQRYFEEERKRVTVPQNGSHKLEMSRSAVIKLKNLGHDMVEVKLVGEGKDVTAYKGALPLGEIVILGGDAKNDTAWFIILRQVEAKK